MFNKGFWYVHPPEYDPWKNGVRIRKVNPIVYVRMSKYFEKNRKIKE
jgi:hypothetical protein